MGKNEKGTEIELSSGSLLRLREYHCLPKEATPYPLDIAILKLDRSQSDAIIHLCGKTKRKCPFCKLVHDAIVNYIWIELSHLKCTCGSEDQRVVLTRLELTDKESQTYEFEAQIICNNCKRFLPRVLRILRQVFTGVKRLRISVTKGEVDLEFKDDK